MRLLANARPKAWPQPRHGNALGLTAELEHFMDVCAQHRDEASIIPDGVKQGWPTEIDFDALPERLRAFRRKLQKIVEEPTISQFFRKAMKDVAEMGALASMSSHGQLAAFERARPG